MVIKVFLANFSQYCEGMVTTGKEVSLPCSPSDLVTVLNEIGVTPEQDYFLLKWSCEVDGICPCISERTSLAEVNYIAGVLNPLSSEKRMIVSALIEAKRPDMNQLTLLLESLSSYILLPDIQEDKELGYYFAETLKRITIPDHIKPYFDYEVYGREMRKTIRGIYTSYGFLLSN